MMAKERDRDGITLARTRHAPRIVAAIVTRDRPLLLRRCLRAVLSQSRPPDAVLVIDNASADETVRVIAEFPSVRAIRLPRNSGGAGGFNAAIREAVAAGAEFAWLMDDDGWPSDKHCLARLLANAARLDIAAPLVLDESDPARLAFPIRLRRRTHFMATAVRAHGTVADFAHLYNGALLRCELAQRIGLPDSRFVLRGDEVDYLHRARRAGARIALLPQAEFLHPGSLPEIHPILGGLFYAVVPLSAGKQYLQFRNRGFIFRRYGRWGFLAADIARYGSHYLLSRRDPAAFARWLHATWRGVRGDFGPPPRSWLAGIEAAASPIQPIESAVRMP